jgi:hypothetical protein
VPLPVQARIKRAAPLVAYVPARSGFGFHYTGVGIAKRKVVIHFRNKAQWNIDFTVTPFSGDCRAGMEKSFQLDGNKVYWSQAETQQQAWRCVGSVKITVSSTQPPTRFADSGLGIVAASGHRIH